MEIILPSDSNLPKVYDFPMFCLPDEVADAIRNVSDGQSLPEQFVATACIWTVSTLAGRRYQSEFNGGGLNILYALLVAPVSVGKTPAIKVACEQPLLDAYKYADAEFEARMQEYIDSLKSKDKENHKPRPRRYIPITTEATTEGIINKHLSQPEGIGVYYDEAESIFSAGNYKGTNDAITFFTQVFNGGRYQHIRADEDKERVLPAVNVNIIMGTQPERLNNVFTEDRITSGFASRFLTVQADYRPLNTAVDPFGPKQTMGPIWKQIVECLFYAGYNRQPVVMIEITEKAKDMYRLYYRRLMEEANQRILSKAETYIIGAEAKLSNYFPRLCQILAIMFNPNNPAITEQTVHNAFNLYRYYQQSSIAAISGMKQVADTGLPIDLDSLYKALPESFTAHDAKMMCIKLGLSARRFEVSIRKKDFATLFKKNSHGTYTKI